MHSPPRGSIPCGLPYGRAVSESRPPTPAELAAVDWSRLPAPQDDGAAGHLTGTRLPAVALPASDGGAVTLADLPGVGVIYVYPMTGRPDRALPDGWDEIPGARGCTPQACAFRDHAADLAAAGVAWLYGLSTQSLQEQREAAHRLHLPFLLLSDADLVLATALRLPSFEAGEATRLKRLTMIVRDGRIEKVFYPVFPPDRAAGQVLEWLQNTAGER